MKYLIKNLFIPFKQIDKLLPNQGVILDLGCGEGAIALYLANKTKRRIIGIDADNKRIEEAKQNNQHKNISFVNADLLKASFPRNFEGCIISDVLHHMSKPNQIKLIKKISQNIKPNGTFVIKEINNSDPIRSKLSRLWDYILYPQDKITYFSKKKLIKLLEKNKFKVKHLKKHLLVPASIHLYISTRL